MSDDYPEKLAHSSDGDSTNTVVDANTTWGEPNVINEASARNDINELNRILSRQSAMSRIKSQDIEREGESQSEKGWLENQLESFVQDKQKNQHPDKNLGITFKNLTIQGIGADEAIGTTVLSAFDIVGSIKSARKPKQVKDIIKNVTGHVGSGEMCLVLGRPGSGCTSLLKVLANQRTSFKNVEGQVSYSGMDHKEAQKFRGEIVMNTEDELHFPTLTVEQTMDFALSLKTPRLRFPGVSSEEFNTLFKETVLKMFGITHTKDTKIGNEYIRGVSGGERKRVSIAELMVTRASCLCWDNSTRGLDASTALEYTKCLRIISDLMGAVNVVTLYQASNKIYDLFDKVMVIESGRCIYFGPRSRAKSYFEDMGFVYTPGANVADFLTGLLMETERIVKPGAKVPNTAEEMEARYLESDIYRDTVREAEAFSPDQALQLEEFRAAAAAEKSKHSPDREPYTVSLWQQIKSCTVRQYELMWGDKSSIILKQGSTLVQALIAGSLFYDLPLTTNGLFTRGGAIFFALLFNALLGLSEVTEAFQGRPVIQKHKHFALYRPSAIALSQVISDIPILLFQIAHFSLVLYFMCNLKREAGSFFIFYLLIFATTMAMFAFFRMTASLCDSFNNASKLSGFALAAIIMYGGFIIPRPSMHPWLSWLFWINPFHYGYEALMANEFHGLTFECVGNTVTPNGANYLGNANKGCGVPGAATGSLSVSGDEYLSIALQFSHSHLWRNFGIVIGFWIFFVIMTMFGMERQKEGASNSSLVFKRPSPWFVRALKQKFAKKAKTQTEKESTLVSNEAIFTWDNVNYTVDVPGGKRQLLNNVKGWVKPGELTALMGSSGAGKTTLLDVLAQRKDSGEITGEILIDGRPLSVSFQRSAGYCEQLDIHESTATVREALEFSAILRQSRDIPREEKIAYVDTIIDLLEMKDIEDAIIGTTGYGLSVEQRKRLTIGVELAAKPTLLTFLDEPTSGLDGQSAFNILRFLRKLSEAGQSVLCTIHQPSASLFEQFDNLLLLANGGKTVYFGPTGKDSVVLNQYFARNGVPCHINSNPAEHMIDVVSGPRSTERDWSQIWLDSNEYKLVCDEIKRLNETCKAKEQTFVEDGHEFAMPLWDQCILVTERCNTALYRNNDYISNKIALHIGSALFNGFTFWMIGDSVTDLQNKMFTIFNFIFVSPAVINQLQPLFLARRDIFEAREKKSKIYSWKAFVVGLILSEIPYLIICAILYFVCWYYTVGFPNSSAIAGAVLLQMILFEFLYTGIGQFIAAYAPNEYFASLTTPLLFGTLVSFCGVLAPYDSISVFWRYWLYYLNPFNYLMGGLMVPVMWDADVKCATKELSRFTPPSGQTCGQYMADFLSSNSGYLVDNSTTAPGLCNFCKYEKGSDYLTTLNLTKKLDGWRDIGITALFCVSSYGFVFLLMKLRSKKTKSAKAE